MSPALSRRLAAGGVVRRLRARGRRVLVATVDGTCLGAPAQALRELDILERWLEQRDRASLPHRAWVRLNGLVTAAVGRFAPGPDDGARSAWFQSAVAHMPHLMPERVARRHRVVVAFEDGSRESFEVDVVNRPLTLALLRFSLFMDLLANVPFVGPVASYVSALGVGAGAVGYRLGGDLTIAHSLMQTGAKYFSVASASLLPADPVSVAAALNDYQNLEKLDREPHLVQVVHHTAT